MNKVILVACCSIGLSFLSGVAFADNNNDKQSSPYAEAEIKAENLVNNANGEAQTIASDEKNASAAKSNIPTGGTEPVRRLGDEAKKN